MAAWWEATGFVGLGGVEDQFAEQFAGGGVDDGDLKVGDRSTTRIRAWVRPMPMWCRRPARRRVTESASSTRSVRTAWWTSPVRSVLGVALVAQLPGLADAPAIGGLVGAVLVSDLRLPVASIIFVLLITHAGGGVAPVTIVAVVVAQIATLSLTNRRHRTREAPPR